MKKFRMKKLVGILSLVFILLLLAAGCGNNTVNLDADSSSNTASNEQGYKETEGQKSAEQELLVYCGAGLRKPMEEIAAMFGEETGTLVQFSYGGSAQCVGQILTVDKGDVFLPGDVAELKELVERDKIDRQVPVVLHIPVIAVPTGNPAGITGINDFTKPGVRVLLGDPEANPIGKLADKMFMEHNIFEEVEQNVVARAATVNELFAYLALEQGDVAIIWEDNLEDHEKIELVPSTDLDAFIKTVPVVSLKCSKNPEEANKFVDYVASEKAMAVWEKCGFRPAAEAN